MSWQDPNGESNATSGMRDASPTPAQPGWGQPAQPPQPAQPGWGTATDPSQVAQPGWGQPAAPQPGAAPGWGAPPQQPPASGWGAPVAWGAPPPGEGRGHGIDDLLGETWRVTRRGLKPLITLGLVKLLGLLALLPAVVVAAPWIEEVTAWTEEFQRLAADPSASRLVVATFPMPPFEAIPLLAVGLVVSGLVGLVASLAMTSLAADVLAGRPTSAGRSLGVGLGRLPAMLGLGLVWFGLTVATMVVLYLSFWLGPLSALFWLGAIILWIVVWIRLIPILTVLVLEEEGPIGSIGRAMALTDGRVLMTLGFSVLTWLIAVIASQVGGYVVGLVAAAFPVLLLLLSGVVDLFVEPWSTSSAVVLYDELRRRALPAWAADRPIAPAPPPPPIDPSGWR